MRKRDVDETTQRWLDVVGEVVAVGARRKERGRKQMSRSKLINRSGARRSGLVVQDNGGVRRWAKVRVLA